MEESVGLKPLIAALLPPESREHVLGDLEESGFRLRDATSAVGAAWGSSFRREWLGPVPDLSSAGDDRINLRVEQLLWVRKHASCWVLPGYALKLAGMAGIPVRLWWAAALLVTLYLILPVPSFGQINARERYRQVLRAGHFFLIAAWYSSRGWCLLLPQPLQTPLLAAVLVLCAALGLHRSKRLSQELKNSPAQRPDYRLFS
ncbi:MAG: hypothetical protein RL328_2411 [Acidobacteriota bacterium]|jgi:hypothetical protein